MSAQQLLADIRAKKFKPVYLLQGDEPYYIDLVTEALEANVLTDAEKGFNQTIMYGRDTTMLQCVTAAKRFPMMSQNQLVLVKEAQAMKWDGATPQENDIIAQYLEKPLDSTVLVFAHKDGKLDGKKKVARLLAKHALVFTSEKVKDYKLPEWVTAYITAKNYKADPRAVAMVAEYLGNNLAKITNEVDKMLINIPPGEAITTGAVHEYIGISKEYNIWELQAALAKKDVLKCNKIINWFAANPKDNPAQRVIISLATWFTRVLKYTYVQNQANAASIVGVSPYALVELKEAVAAYSLREVFNIIHMLRLTDLKTKGVGSTGNTGDYELLKELIFNILHVRFIPEENELLVG